MYIYIYQITLDANLDLYSHVTCVCCFPFIDGLPIKNGDFPWPDHTIRGSSSHGARKSCPREYVSRSTWISRDIGIYKWIAKSHLNHPVPIYTNMVLSCLLQHSVSLKSIGLSPFARQTIAVSGRIYEPFSNTHPYIIVFFMTHCITLCPHSIIILLVSVTSLQNLMVQWLKDLQLYLQLVLCLTNGRSFQPFWQICDMCGFC